MNFTAWLGGSTKTAPVALATPPQPAMDLLARARAERQFIEEAEIPAAGQRVSQWLATNRRQFEAVERFVMFIGYGRSGHSLLGSLIDAHPEAMISHELDLLRFVQSGFTREQIFGLILENSRQYAGIGRVWGEYQYGVPDQWQGMYRRLRVIGDKKGGITAVRYADDQTLPERVHRLIGMAPHYLHVIRDPLDCIATNSRKTPMTLPQAADRYFRQAQAVEWLRTQVDRKHLLDIHYCDFLAEPALGLRQTLQFVGLSADDDYLAACCGVIREPKRRSRDLVQWPAGLIDSIQQRAAQIEFLKRYL